MKKLILFASILLALSACSNSASTDDNPGTTDPQVTGGTWKVSYYYDKDKVETSNYTGYSFDFQSGGTLVAHLPGAGTQSGTWEISNNRFHISIAGTNDLEKMTSHWILIEKTDVSIKLKDDNTTQLEELHFSKL